MIRAIARCHLVAGHHLRPPYEGKCSKPHGHNYKIEATFESKEPDARGFAGIDFGEFKAFVRKFDHEMLNNHPPFDTLQPSAENLARYLGESFHNCVKVRVWETDDGIAEWERDEEDPT